MLIRMTSRVLGDHRSLLFNVANVSNMKPTSKNSIKAIVRVIGIILRPKLPEVEKETF